MKALKAAIHANIADEKREKDEVRQRAASERARSRRVESDAVREKEEEQLKEKLKTLPDGNKVGFKLDDIGVFRSIFNACEGLGLDEIPFVFSKDGMSVKLMDPSHIALLDVSIPANNFYNYAYEGPATTQVAFRTDDLKAASKIFAQARSLTWIIQGEKAAVDMGNGHSLQLDLIDSYYSRPPSPNLELKAKVVMSKYALAKVLRECALAEEGDVRITVDPKRQVVTFEGKGNLGGSRVELKRNGDVYDILGDEVQRSTYHTGYLHTVVRAALADTVTIQLSDKYPIRLDFPLSDVREGATLTYWLAPRVDQDTAQPVTPQPEPDEGPGGAEQQSSHEQATKKPSKPKKKSK